MQSMSLVKKRSQVQCPEAAWGLIKLLTCHLKAFELKMLRIEPRVFQCAQQGAPSEKLTREFALTARPES